MIVPVVALVSGHQRFRVAASAIDPVVVLVSGHQRFRVAASAIVPVVVLVSGHRRFPKAASAIGQVVLVDRVAETNLAGRGGPTGPEDRAPAGGPTDRTILPTGTTFTTSSTTTGMVALGGRSAAAGGVGVIRVGVLGVVPVTDTGIGGLLVASAP